MNLAHDDLGPRDGQPVLLVHGHPFDRSMWRPQAEYLAERGYRVVTPDLRGYGGSSTGDTKTGLDVFANDLVELADRLGLGRFVLGGLSMGGQIVMQLVTDHPQRVEALLLADTFAGLDTPAAKQARYDTADRITEEGMERYADELLPKMISKQTRATRPDVEAHVRRMMRDAPKEGAAAALRGRAERPDYVPALKDIDVPTLVVVGSEDEFTPVADAELIHREIRGSTLVVVEGAGHLPNLERETEFDEALSTFLKNSGATP
ncbi:alpha/beta fold hydrolase [Amycolatopsis sp. SID8362]|uniref:alpha/beta fold hydrolase n=1 Tax=Amycolatopsis sp. SID8362 TaxID=2690346 RepID=UPI00136B06C6|nr:alpha/beta fold hydrolase [Amycolatopsis sp. SID8362]NBH11996.1 alpha/beta fold hydrolase [Amycolatopsis sp. SID8362]NED48687.1 alpha/beta fold hydrolase [Amycolatopsis sp. SID8362]